ncbi:PRK06851 family protein [Terrisporobacter petrolearius]|uniref:PRK06851 family protein n=1 Tax=Terrisporobacter petrolearius TaxID=1460447 RepID=UPI001D165672|nr:PRK06851 family protein [Terrisporobacter petrolearius]MCC3865140.1 PRK06851 family protein [Terrisporobacter petrolearius]
MKGKIRKVFPGANTSNGFYSYFDYIIPKDVNRIFCLKGGPGVGKSSLMKKVARDFSEIGYDVEVFPCSSDPSSLDAVVVKKLKVVLLDATAPHVVDPKIPGAIDEIVNFGDFWNVDNLEKNKEEVVQCNKEIGECFQRAFKYLKAAEPIFYDIESKNMDMMNFGKLNKFTDEFMEEIFKGIENKDELSNPRHLFGTAITPIGHIDYSDSLLQDAKKVYYLDGKIGYGKTTFLKRVYDKAILKGLKVEVFHYPLIPEKIESIMIIDLGIAITTSSLFENKDAINLGEFIDKEKIDNHKEEVEVDEKILDELINYAISNLKKAKSNHDVIEGYYIPNMDFDKINQLKEELIGRILKYENK